MPFVSIKGKNHFYSLHHSNQSETILFVHGHPFNHSQWNYQISALQEFKLIIPDLKGYGNTIDIDSPKIYIEDHAQELNLMLDQLNIDRVHLVGLSMGGQIIVEFAKQYPHRTKSLVLCNSLPFAETESSKTIRIEAGYNLLELGIEHHVTNNISTYIHPLTFNENNTAFIHLKEMMLTTNASSAAANHFGRAERRDNAEFLQAFKKPIHFICGEADNFTPSEKMILVANSIGPNLYNIVPNTGHLTNMENPSFFNQILTQFYINNF